MQWKLDRSAPLVTDPPRPGKSHTISLSVISLNDKYPKKKEKTHESWLITTKSSRGSVYELDRLRECHIIGSVAEKDEI